MMQSDLKKVLISDNVASMSQSYTYKGEAFYQAYAKKESELPNEETIYGLASLTKSLVAVLVMILQERNKLSVEDLVSTYIPELNLPNKIKKELSIHHLLTHTGGFPGMIGVNLARKESILNDPDGAYLFGGFPETEKEVITVLDMIEVLNAREIEFIAEPGELFNYSNESYALLQLIIERVSGVSFEQFARREVFDLLGMQRSFFSYEDIKDEGNKAAIYAYTKDEAKELFLSPTWWESGEIYGAGALKSTAGDISRYLSLFLNETVLSRESLDFMTSPLVETPNGNQYGYGLMVDEINGLKVVGHGGGIKGVSSYMLIVEELEFTCVTLCNVAEVPAEDYTLATFFAVTQIKREDRPKQVKEMIDPSAYLGVYQTEENQRVEVSLKSQKVLLLKIQARELEAHFIGEDLFILPNGRKVAFVRRQGQVIGIFRGMRYLPKVKVEGT